MFRIGAHTDKGPRKESNQDSCCGLVAQTPLGETALLSVCDGVGGLTSGELASSSVIKWLVAWFEQAYPRLLSTYGTDYVALFDHVQDAWEKGLYEMNDELRNYGRKSDKQLGTTCTAVLLFQGSYLIVHVGDTRVYRFTGGRMDILTVDQTWVAQEVARGNIAPEKARTHPKRNVILQSVGTQNELQPIFSRGGYETGDAFMVCCDGFRNELFDDELVESFGALQHATERDISQACSSLVDLVLQRGERDNVTAIALSCQAGTSGGEDDGSEPTTRFDDPKTTILPQTGSGSTASELGGRS